MGKEPKQDTDNYCRLKKEIYELLTWPGTEVTNLIFPSDYVAWFSWKYSEDNVVVRKNFNVAVVAYVTTQARLKLYEYQSKFAGVRFVL